MYNAHGALFDADRVLQVGRPDPPHGNITLSTHIMLYRMPHVSGLWRHLSGDVHTLGGLPRRKIVRHSCSCLGLIEEYHERINCSELCYLYTQRAHSQARPYGCAKPASRGAMCLAARVCWVPACRYMSSASCCTVRWLDVENPMARSAAEKSRTMSCQE